VSIAVPKNFSEIDPSAFLNSSNQSDFSSQNPDLAPFLSAGNEFLRGSVLAASGTDSGTPAFVVVSKSPEQFDPSDASVKSEFQSQFETLGATNVKIDEVTLPAGDALRASGSFDINAGTSTKTVDETLYFVSVGRTTWVIVGVTVGSSTGELFDQIANTFTVSS
jgi:hypothetical protein